MRSPISSRPPPVSGGPRKRGSRGRTRGGVDRGRKGFRLPSLRTVRAVLPHAALQSLVSSSGVPRAFVSCFEGEQPAIREKEHLASGGGPRKCDRGRDASPACAGLSVAVCG